MNNRQIKHFREHNFKVELAKYQSQKAKVFILKALYTDSFNIADHTTEALEKMLIKLTGIINPSMAANSINMLKEYNLICEIAQDLQLENFDNKGDLTKDFTASLRDKYTTYYTQEELDNLAAIQVAVDALNKLDVSDAKAIQYHFLQSTFVYREDFARTQKQFSKLR